MQNLNIQPYQNADFQVVSQLFEDFMDYIINLDDLGITRKQINYGEKYLQKNIKDVETKNGSFLIAKIDKKVVGLGVAVVDELSNDDLIELVPHTPGRIMELYVDRQYRKHGIGTKIMQMLEKYLVDFGCNTIRIGVFVPNYLAHKLYEKLGYKDRNVDMTKVITKARFKPT
jgi:ribosomal protein S18 acetylase RimI-like enzyme